METTDLDPFDVLGVAPNATRKEIRAAWRRRLFECHPDHGGSTEATRAVNDAWATLSDPQRLEAARAARRARDAARRAAHTPPPRSEPPPRSGRSQSDSQTHSDARAHAGARRRSEPPPRRPPPRSSARAGGDGSRTGPREEPRPRQPPPRPSSRPQAPRPTPPPPRSPGWSVSPRTRTRLRRLMRVFLLVWLVYYGLGWCRSNAAPSPPSPPEVIEQHGPVESIATDAASCQTGEVTVRVGRAGTTVVVEVTDPTITNENGPARSWALDIDGRDGRLLNVNGTDVTATVTVFGRLSSVMVEVGADSDAAVVEAPVRVDARTHRITLNLSPAHVPTASGSFDWEVHRVIDDETAPLCGGVTPSD